VLERRQKIDDDWRTPRIIPEEAAMSQPSLPIVAGLTILAAGLFAPVSGRAADPATKSPFAVEQVDLSDMPELQTVVDREAGQYLGHPTTVLLEDGRTMIIVYPKGHGRGEIVMKRSTDGGRTWSERLPTPASWATSQEVPTIYRTIDQRGKKRLILFSGLYPIRRAVSEDDGATWSELEPIGDYGGIVACASCERLKNGDYLALFHDDGRFLRKQKPPKGTKPRFIVYKILSSDGGLTWSEPEAIAEHTEAHLCEPGLVRSPDGKELAVLLRENSRKFRSFVIFSRNEGKTWTEPRELPAELTGDRHTAKYVAGKNLFISFRDNLKGSPTYGDWVAWLGTYEDIVQGKPGLARFRLMDNTKGADCAYPAVDVLPDGSILTTTYGHWTKDEMPYIVSVRIDKERLAEEIILRTIVGFDVGTGRWRTLEPKLEWNPLPSLSDLKGFAGQFVGVANNRLLLYGGSNFPDTPVWSGGTKRWYRDAFVLDKPDGTWRMIGALDESRPVGYGVSLPTADGKILCIGGADAVRHYDTVFVLGLEGDKLTTIDLPKLPKPCAYTAGAILGGKVYVAGGIDRPDATRGMHTFWSLDLAKPESGWQELPTWPGRGRMLATVAVDGEYLYLTGGCDLTSDIDGKPLRLYLPDTFRYSPKTGWEKLADAPVGIVAAPTPALTAAGHVIVFGGDDSTNLGFKPPEKHPGFPNNVYAYDVKHDRWTRIGATPFVPVATPLVKWLDGHVVASGEIRPGVRTREVWLVKPLK
jgi:N-acetylneuraminic acid mutarotase